jgi:CubicO group peptidase (beta-lactamase class C family)
MTDVAVAGIADSKFDAVREAFEANLASGADLGASFCATVEGETVVDLWGGWADEARTRPWERDTIVNVYSTSKTMTALTALLLADRDALDLGAPVARYWPEFAANGKAGITTKHLLSHSAGLSGWREPLTTADLFDWEKATVLLAAQAPFWEPGTASGYHSLTQGYLVGEVVRRVTGKSLGTVFREEIAQPLGADFHIGFGPEHDHRVADLIPPEISLRDALFADGNQPSTMVLASLTNPPLDPLETRSRAWRAAEIPAAGGHGNARSIAAVHVLLANGGVAGGKRLMSEAGCRRALEPQIEGDDLILGMPASFGLGFGLGSMLDLPNPGRSIWWGGYGGSLVLIDTAARTTMGYAMNRMDGGTMGDERAMAMARAMWSALGA